MASDGQNNPCWKIKFGKSSLEKQIKLQRLKIKIAVIYFWLIISLIAVQADISKRLSNICWGYQYANTQLIQTLFRNLSIGGESQ